MKPLCIFHGGCDDGFASAWVVKQATGDMFEFYPGVYQQEPPDVAGRHVLMVDFSYKRPVIELMAAQAASILILDHHKTAQEDLHGYAAAPSSWAEWIADYFRSQLPPHHVAVEFDMERCGATITWDFFFPAEEEQPEFIQYIEDRDLSRRQLPNCDEFTMALRSYPQDFDIWNALVSAGPYPLIGEGTAILRYYRARIEDLKREAHPSVIAGVPCWIANAPYFAASELAGDLADREGGEFGACWYVAANGHVKYSLRSRGEFDVSEIAKHFGGGGHKNAAGFSAPRPIH